MRGSYRQQVYHLPKGQKMLLHIEHLRTRQETLHRETRENMPRAVSWSAPSQHHLWGQPQGFDPNGRYLRHVDQNGGDAASWHRELQQTTSHPM